MREFVPDGYADFCCIADRCRHTCCAGWEIDVDTVTAALYRAMPGRLGDELRAALKDGDFFAPTADGRCPFLNEQGLCRLILAQGEDSLCQICSDHPRYVTELSDRTEVGLGLCCEAAGRLLLNREATAFLCCAWDDGEREPLTEAEQAMLTERAAVLHILQDRSLPFAKRRVQLIRRYNLRRFDEIADALPGLLQMFEIMDPEWPQLLSRSDRPVPVDEVRQEQLAFSLVMRHFARVLDGYTAAETVMFILQMHELIIRHVFDAAPEALVQTARLFSSEIEYSDENPELILGYLRDQNRTPTAFEQQVYNELKKIPRGKVTTYGMIAKRIGKPGAARAVGQALHRNPDPVNAPCYRVVNGEGRVADHFGLGGGEAQARLLRRDGIPVTDGKVDLTKYSAWEAE